MAIQDFDPRFEPFGPEPDYRLYYNSRPHAKALITINEGIAAGEGFVVVTGEPGSGRTTLLNFVMSRLEPGRFVAARLNARECQTLPVLRLVARGFGMATGGSGEEVLETKLKKFLADSRRRGRRGLLLIDEAQELPPAAFEALLRLSSPRDEEGQVLQAVLFGQAELRDLLYGHDLSRYRLNVVASHHLQALDLAETRRLIDHRLRQSGSSADKVFADDCIEMIHLQTGGIPGRVVNLCRDLMERAATMGLSRVDAGVVQQISLKRKKDWVRHESAGPDEQDGAALHLTEPAPPEARDGIGPEDALPAFLAREQVSDQVAERGKRPRLSPVLGAAALLAGAAALALFAWQRQVEEPTRTGITLAWSENEQPSAPPTEEPAAPSDAEADPGRAAGPETEPASGPPALAGERSSDEGTPDLAPAADPALEDRAASDAQSSLESPAGSGQEGTGFLVPPPPALEEEAPTTSPAPPETAEAVEATPADVPTAPEAQADPGPPSLAAEAPAEADQPAEGEATLDLPNAPRPDEADVPATTALADAEMPPAPIDLTPWKSGDEAASSRTGQNPAGPISDLGDKAVSQATAASGAEAAGEPDATIVENARLAEASTEPGVPAAPALSVAELLLARAIEDREPVGLEEPFGLDDKEIYAYARVSNPGPQTQVLFRWYLNGAFVGQAEMTVGTSPAWRTWSVAPLDRGSWRVEVTDLDGRVLSSRAFNVD